VDFNRMTIIKKNRGLTPVNHRPWNPIFII